MRVARLGGWMVLALALLSGCADSNPTPAAKTPEAATAAPEKIPTSHVPNVYRLHEKVLSGGLPDGEAGFAELERLGVKTVISVDGAKPDVSLARKHGMRYVHLPHGYDGIPEQRAQELAKAVRDLEGPVYIHCHHGKHRSPAAATVACVSAGMVSPKLAHEILKTAGTSEHYRGLYASAEEAHPLDAALLDAMRPDFPETASIPPMAEAMVAIEHTHEHLKALEANSWRRLAKQPDLDPSHEALLLREHFTELLRTEEVQRQPEEFRSLVKSSETAAQQLEDALRVWQAGGAVQPAPNEAGEALARVSSDCKQCHEKFRDVPLDEKARH